jgi:hypothetical protein
MASSMSTSLGAEFPAKSPVADMICPDWQYPHCGTSSSLHAARTASAAFPLDTFDRHDLHTRGVGQARLARTNGRTVRVNRARPAQSLAAAEFGPDQFQFIPQNPEQRRIRLGVDAKLLPVYV